MHAGTDNYTYLTTAPIRRVIPTMAIPTIISMLVTALYNMADTFFVGKLDTQSTAAVGVVFSMMFFVQAIGFFFGHGSGNYISRELGARRHDNAARMAATGFCFSVIAGTLIAVLGWIFLNPLSLLLGATPTILPHTRQYLGIVLFGAPFLTGSLTLNNQLRLQGNASFAMVGIVAGAILNVGLDPLFIFVCHWGVAGAALATVTGQVVSFLILFFMTRRGENIAIRFRLFSPSWSAFKEIFFGGSPSLCRQGLLCLATTMLNHAAGNYGDAAIAAMSIVQRIVMFGASTMLGFGQGFKPVCGFNYGAGLYTRVKQGFRFCVRVSTLVLLSLSILGYLFAPRLVELFRDDPDVITCGVQALRFQCLTFWVQGWVVTSNMLQQAIGRTVPATFLSIARQGLFFIPLIWLLPLFWGLTGIEMTQSVADLLTFLCAIPIQIHVLKSLPADRPVRPC